MTTEHFLTVSEAAREFNINKLNLGEAIKRGWLPSKLRSYGGPAPVYVVTREEMQIFVDSGRNDQIYVDATHPERPIRTPTENAVTAGKLRKRLELRQEAKEAGCPLKEYLIMIGEEEEYA